MVTTACDDINARAFTVGNQIAFNRGEYDPESAEGQHVLAHELAHVRQQTGGAVSMLPQDGELAIDPDERLEREAEQTAERVMRGGTLGIQRMRRGEVHVQRMPEAEQLEQAREEFDQMDLQGSDGQISSIAKRVAEYLGFHGGAFSKQDMAAKATTGAVGAIPIAGPFIQNVTDEAYDQQRQVTQVRSALHDIGPAELPTDWVSHISDRAVKKVEAQTGVGESQGVGASRRD
ncbi:DUF4157 domain-containing protein [Haloarcula sp. S1CR25-12]|uniref:DUF4157 domain-containing protein n=1 Tax=Haloarcula saliterrae TaxID=2950534 RepID=A0ABU2FE46_9EURY|nr:DUF4157 domain-containing protein [Haloarcula sp. S1CR25-12]MDS0260519.1 DUF4157 domain-containing protein [Haloarcula sp. S1CR25-12]